MSAKSQSTTAAAGTAPAGVTPAPAPQLNGTLQQEPNTAPVYSVINGLLCWIPDLLTISNLIAPGATITQNPNLAEIAVGTPLTSGAVLVKGDVDESVYLVSNAVKMWIPSPTIFGNYQFNWAKVVVVPQIVINSIPDGPQLDGPQQTA